MRRAKYFVFVLLTMVSGCALKQGYVKIEDQTHYVIPKPEIAELKMNPVVFNTPDKQKSGICFETTQDAKNYLNNLVNVESYIKQQKNVIEYYDNSKK